MRSNSSRALTAASALVFVAIACSKPSAEAGTGGGGRTAQTLNVAETDVTVARRSTLVDGVAITGTLRPIETVEVRARLEGDLQGVYVREGDFVRAGQLLARFESTEQESTAQSAVADRVAAQGELSTAEWNLEQSQQLFAAGAIPETDLRVARNAVATARARLAATNSRLRTTSMSARDTRVIAPTSGVIEKRLVENGEHIAQGGEMFTLVRNDILELAAAVPERRANAVRVGQRVEFDANGAKIVGRVARLSPTIDPVSRSITVYVQIPNAAGTIRGGTFVTGTVLSRTITNAMVIPQSALRQTATGTQLTYKIENGALDTATVQAGVVDDRLGVVEALTGVADGDSLIAGNVGSLAVGMKVQILSSGKDRAAGAAGPTAAAPVAGQPQTSTR
ncbi:MAG: efflux RND transporter periplasmic adaptor subunit [Gemmatimonadota bacterium]|nr:efflux RND transporter periplasmic adaptor subunit [Gemmatimonadota bacterium]